MAGEPNVPEAALAILMGASEFPYTDLDPLMAAANVARDVVKYLTSKTGLNVPRRNILNLFDSELPPSEMDERVASFLKQRQEALRGDNLTPRNLIFYYIGHGGFTPRDQDYFLALRTTKKGREGPSGIRMIDLAVTLTTSAKDLRRFLILDCCFAGSAEQFFEMSNPAEAMHKKTMESFPRKGTALLCSSSASNISLAPKKEKYTMFSGVLLEILRNGRPSNDLELSFKQIADKVREGIETKFENKSVRPKVSSPDEREGDIASIPLFPNPSYRPAAQRELPARHDNSISVRNPSRARVNSLMYMGLGIIGLVLPGVLAVGKTILDGPGIGPSIGSYYYSDMRNVFVVSFCAIGLLTLFSIYYNLDAYAPIDRVVQGVMCICAFGVGLFPTTPPFADVTAWGIVRGYVHAICLIFFFLAFAYSSLVLFTRTAGNQPTPQKLVRNRVYRMCGFTILFCILFILSLQLIGPRLEELSPVFWLESLAMVAFGVASLVKTQVLLKD